MLMSGGTIPPRGYVVLQSPRRCSRERSGSDQSPMGAVSRRAMQAKRKGVKKPRAKKGASLTKPRAPKPAPMAKRAKPGRPSTTSSRHVTGSQLKMLAAIGRGISTMAALDPILAARNTVVLPAVQHRKHVAMLAGLITRGFVKELGGGRYELSPKGRVALTE